MNSLVSIASKAKGQRDLSRNVLAGCGLVHSTVTMLPVENDTDPKVAKLEADIKKLEEHIKLIDACKIFTDKGRIMSLDNDEYEKR